MVKLFDGVDYLGQVAGWVAGGEANKWLVVYCDGDTEEMSKQELSSTVLAALHSTHEPKSMAKMQKALVLRVEEWLRKHDAELKRALARDRSSRQGDINTGVTGPAAGSKRRRDAQEPVEEEAEEEEMEEEETEEAEEAEDEEEEEEEKRKQRKRRKRQLRWRMPTRWTRKIPKPHGEAKKEMLEQESKETLSKGVADTGTRVCSIFEVLGKAPAAGAQGGSSTATTASSATARASTTATAATVTPSSSASRSGGGRIEGKKGGDVIKRIEEENAEKVAKVEIRKSHLYSNVT